MSRIGIKPVEIASGVVIEMTPTKLSAKGNGAVIDVALPYGIKVSQKENKIIVERLNDSKHVRSLHGTIRNLINNAVTGVSKGFEKKLELVGIGYRAALEGSDLVLQVGFTHPVKMRLPEGLQAKIEKNVITLSGANKEHLGQFAAEVRAVRPPEPYKGKGIRYVGELVRMKQGKAMKSGS